MSHICPWWLAYTFDHSLRRFVHNPEKMLHPYLEEGMTAVDIGCGMGYFSIAMAGLVGDKGSVIAVDLQQRMLDVLKKRAERAGMLPRIRCHRCDSDDIGIKDRVDFALTFWMVHEVPDAQRLLRQIHDLLKPTGQYLLVEPKIHCSRDRFQETGASANKAGLSFKEYPTVRFSYAALFVKTKTFMKP